MFKRDSHLQQTGATGSLADVFKAASQYAGQRHGLANLWRGAQLRGQRPGSHEKLHGMRQKRLVAEALLLGKPAPLAPVPVMQDIVGYVGQYCNEELLAAACRFVARRPSLIPALLDGTRLHDHRTGCMPEVSRYLDACKQIVTALPYQQLKMAAPYTTLVARLAAEIRQPDDIGLLSAAADRFHHDARFHTIIKNATDYICMSAADLSALRTQMKARLTPAPLLHKRKP